MPELEGNVVKTLTAPDNPRLFLEKADVSCRGDAGEITPSLTARRYHRSEIQVSPPGVQTSEIAGKPLKSSAILRSVSRSMPE